MNDDRSRQRVRSGSESVSLAAGDLVPLTIDKVASGGRMIGRKNGQVVLVAGAIPGERVMARVERVEKRLAFATTVEVLESSPDRREALLDPSCGGSVYAHITYGRQLALKGEVVADAFARIGRLPLSATVPVSGAGERGYRMRARLHAQGGRAGFFREGTHQLCDASSTGQLLDASIRAIDAALSAMGQASDAVTSIEISENIAADERAFHLDVR